MEETAPAVFTAVLCIAHTSPVPDRKDFVFLLFVGRSAKGERNVIADTVILAFLLK
jgi:hypothetical protein